MDGFPQTDTITLQHVATKAFLRGTKHRDEAIVVINESPSNIQQACKRLKTVIANKQAIIGQKVSFKESFTTQEDDRVLRIKQRLDSLFSGFRESSSLPVCGDGRSIRGDSPADNFRQRNYCNTCNGQRSPSYGRDWHHNKYRGNYEPRDWQSRERSPTHWSFRDDNQVGTLLGGLLFRIDNMGWGVHIITTLHPLVVIPEVSLTDRVEITTLFLVGHTIGLQITKVIGLKTMSPRVRSLQINLDLFLQL